jgi:hypothetical protein
MTQQTVLLRQLWHNQPPQGYRYRALIKADPYSWDEGRSFWLLANPTLAQNHTVLATHVWAEQDQSLAYPPAVGATISFNADVSPYMRKNGIPGFGLINLRNVVVEEEDGAHLAEADYDMTEDDITADEFVLAATEALAGTAGDLLLTNLDSTDAANGRLEQNIAAGAHWRTEKLTQRIQFNERLANLALLIEEVTGEFIQAWQRAQAVAADLARLQAELVDDPDMEEERHDLQKLANRQRDLAAAYWRWQPPQPIDEEAPIEASSTATSQSLSTAPFTPTVQQQDTAETPQPSVLQPLAVAPVSELPIAEQEAPQFDIRQMIADELKTASPKATPSVPSTPKRKATKRPPAPQATHGQATPPDVPVPISLQDQPADSAMTQAGQTAAPATTPTVEGEAANGLLSDDELLAGKLDEAVLEEPTGTEQNTDSPSPFSERAKDIKSRHAQIVKQVWRLVYRKQPRKRHGAPYILAQIKDGRRRDTDHLKLIGLKAIVELLDLLGVRPTRKDLGSYLGYDLPEGWSLVKLRQEKLPQEDERVREEIVRDIRITMAVAA